MHWLSCNLSMSVLFDMASFHIIVSDLFKLQMAFGLSIFLFPKYIMCIIVLFYNLIFTLPPLNFW